MAEARFTLLKGLFGVDVFEYTVGDGDGGTVSATVTVNVAGPPVLASDESGDEAAPWLAGPDRSTDGSGTEAPAGDMAMWDGTEDLAVLDPAERSRTIVDAGAMISAQPARGDFDDATGDVMLNGFDDLAWSDGGDSTVISELTGADRFDHEFVLIGEMTDEWDATSGRPLGSGSAPDDEAPAALPDGSATPIHDAVGGRAETGKSLALFWGAWRAALGVRRKSG